MNSITLNQWPNNGVDLGLCQQPKGPIVIVPNFPQNGDAVIQEMKLEIVEDFYEVDQMELGAEFNLLAKTKEKKGNT